MKPFLNGSVVRSFLQLAACILFLLSAPRTEAFALLGPFQSWMQETNGFSRSRDIGGPMALGEEYRWNVPVVTYGFDPSFDAFFGSNGIAAVEAAISILNALPTASEINLADFPLDTRKRNPEGAEGNLFDLKSTVLSVLVEQLGLAEPTRNLFVLRQWVPAFIVMVEEPDWSFWAVPYYILKLNFDPESRIESSWINETLWSAKVLSASHSDVVEFPVDPLAPQFMCVADRALLPGEFYENLTRDDVGGLRYLLSATNVNFEMLLPDVRGAGSNAACLVRHALRPGVEKIIFVRQPYDELLERFQPLTNRYVDRIIVNGMVVSQQVERVTIQPDFLFVASDMGEREPFPPSHVRTDTSEWWNAAAYLGLMGAGPGLIRPPVTIRFHTRDAVDVYSASWGTQVHLDRWAWLDKSTNAPIVFPEQVPSRENLTVRFWLHNYSSLPIVNYRFELPVPTGAQVMLQSSTNLIDWKSEATLLNTGEIIDWNWWRYDSQHFFRVIAP
jgi:hypothetical protein